MKELKIEYKVAGFSKCKLIQIPSGWKELTPIQFIAAAKMYVGGISETDFLKQFFGLSNSLINRLGYYDKYKILELVEFVRDARVPFSDFFLPAIPGTDLLAPGSRLSGVCFQQFMTVDTFFSKYIATEKEEYLDQMVAALYIRRNERYVILEKDSDVVLLDIAERLPEIQQVEPAIKMAIFLNYILIKKWLGRAYVHLFPEPEEVNTAVGHKSTGTVKWLDIFDSFVGDNIPDMDKYQAMPALDAFRIMNRKIREAKKNGNH